MSGDKSKSQQRIPNDAYRREYERIFKVYDKPEIKPYGGRPILAGVNVVGVVTQGAK